MESIVNFLSSSHDTGLYVLTYKLELSKVAEFIDFVNENYQERRSLRSSGTDVIQSLLEREEKDWNWYLSDRVASTLSYIIRNDCKPEICTYFKFSPEDLEKALSDTEHRRPPLFTARRFVSGFLKSRIFHQYLDVLHIDYKISKRNKNIMIELLSLNESGFNIFNDLISCLPVLNDSLIKISQRKSHSEKYIFKLYDMVVKLWIDEEDRFLLNENIKNFLEASINYHIQKEWRTSIILSSIVVEGIFAELYEEEYKKDVPDIPLGGLIKEVEKKISLPGDLKKKIEELNKARIASVHRSENPVSDKDAIVSMMGAIALIIWYFKNY